MFHKIIAAAVAVHRELGPGLPRAVYVECLSHELDRLQLHYARDAPVPVTYRGVALAPFPVDFVVENEVIVDVKAVESIRPSHMQQLVSLMRHARICKGLLVNFHAPLLKQGLRRRQLRPEELM